MIGNLHGMNKTKLKDGITRIAGALVAFSAPALGLLGAILVLAAVSAAAHSVIANDADWTRLTADLRVVVGLVVSVLGSISLTQWVLIVLVCVAFGIYVSNREILAKLEHIESELSNIRADSDKGSHRDDDLNDS
jgi:hypothetical protein